MSHEEPVIEQTAAPSDAGHAMAAHDTAADAPPTLSYGAVGEDDWLEEPEELPRRPRRRFLAPVPVALLAVLVAACGFIGGVLVEKGQTSSGTSASGAASLASRFAALRGAGSSAGATSSTSGAFGSSAGAGATTGQVAFISGSTLYVTTAEGNTVKVTTSPGSTVTKSVKADVKGIHPGETVVVTGTAGANGSISAESIRVGSGSAAGDGLGALFGGGGGSASKSSRSSAGSSGEPALFGSG